MRKPNTKDVAPNILASVITALYSVPEGMAYAQLANINPVFGLYSGMVPVLVASLTTGTILMVSTLTSAIALTTGSIFDNASISSSQITGAVVTLSLLTGLIMLVLGVLRLGKIVNFVSNGVMTGFIAGVALLIVAGKIGDVFGYEPSTYPGEPNKVAKAIYIVLHPGNWQLQSTIIGIGTIVLLLVLKRFPKVEPLAPIVAVVAGTVAVQLLGFSSVQLVNGIATIPSSLPAFTLPDWSLVPVLFVGAVSVTLVALSQGAGVSTAYPNPDGSRSDQSRDFIGQGVGNIAGSFFQAMGTGGSLSRTAVAVGAGSSSRLAGVLSAVVLAAVVLVLAPVVGLIPMPVIGGLLVVIGTELVLKRIPDARLAFATSRASAVVMIITFVLSLIIQLQWAIIAGALLSMALYIGQSSGRARLEQFSRTADQRWEVTDLPKTIPPNAVTVLAYEGAGFFADVPVLAEEMPSVRDTRQAVVILYFRGGGLAVTSTHLKWLRQLTNDLNKTGSHLILVGIDSKALHELEASGLAELIGKENIFPFTGIIHEDLEQAWTRANLQYNVPPGAATGADQAQPEAQGAQQVTTGSA
jgi:SulP family sulfate permease